ncbi:hypothetical protein [Kitasatospora nipponensis]
MIITPDPTAPPGPATADDVLAAVRAALTVLAQAPADAATWQLPAHALDWTRWETIEHTADGLLAYAAQLAPGTPPLDGYVPLRWQRDRPQGPPNAIGVDPAAGAPGLLQVLEVAAVLLAALLRTLPPQVRAFHAYGVADPGGFAAMGVVEILAHTQDVAAAFGLVWEPPADLCDRALTRLFPQAPTGTDRWATLLWATGRGELPGHPKVDFERWQSAPPAGAES